jgi:hypothetical protein
MEHVRTVLTRWQQAQQAIRDTAALLGLPLDQMNLGDRPLTELVNELSEILSRAREQLMASDWLGLADTLGYELDDAAALWMDLLDTLADRIERLRQQSGGGDGQDGAAAPTQPPPDA